MDTGQLETETEMETKRAEKVFDEWTNTRDEARVTVRGIQVWFVKRGDDIVLRVYDKAGAEAAVVLLPR